MNCRKLWTGQGAGPGIGAAGIACADLPAPGTAGPAIVGRRWRGRECLREDGGYNNGGAGIVDEDGGREGGGAQ